MSSDKTFFQRLFRVPVAPVGTNIHKKDDFSWLKPSVDGPPEILYPSANDGQDEEYMHPYDREKKSKKSNKRREHNDKSSDTSSNNSEQSISMWQLAEDGQK